MRRRQFLASSLAVAVAARRALDLRSFHEVVPEGGAMPLEVLERVVNDWVRGELS